MKQHKNQKEYIGPDFFNIKLFHQTATKVSKCLLSFFVFIAITTSPGPVYAHAPTLEGSPWTPVGTHAKQPCSRGISLLPVSWQFKIRKLSCPLIVSHVAALWDTDSALEERHSLTDRGRKMEGTTSSCVCPCLVTPGPWILCGVNVNPRSHALRSPGQGRKAHVHPN